MEDFKNREQKRNLNTYQKQYKQYSFSSNISDQEFRSLATRSLKGELSQDEWSRLTPALRKKLERFIKKIRKTAKSTDFLSQLPADAIIKDVSLDENSEKDIK